MWRLADLILLLCHSFGLCATQASAPTKTDKNAKQSGSLQTPRGGRVVKGYICLLNPAPVCQYEKVNNCYASLKWKRKVYKKKQISREKGMRVIEKYKDREHRRKEEERMSLKDTQSEWQNLIGFICLARLLRWISFIVADSKGSAHQRGVGSSDKCLFFNNEREAGPLVEMLKPTDIGQKQRNQSL